MNIHTDNLIFFNFMILLLVGMYNMGLHWEPMLASRGKMTSSDLTDEDFWVSLIFEDVSLYLLFFSVPAKTWSPDCPHERLWGVLNAVILDNSDSEDWQLAC